MRTVCDLLAVIDAYLAASGLRETQLSARLFDDSKKIAALRRGADLVTARFNASCAWLDANWPDGAVWPATVHRPEKFDPAAPAATVPFAVPEVAP